MAGKFNLGEPTSRRITGWNITQDDMPHWVMAILAWIAKYEAITTEYHKDGKVFSDSLELAIKQNKLHKLDEIYTKWARWKRSQ